jgi:hypothetical protein
MYGIIRDFWNQNTGGLDVLASVWFSSRVCVVVEIIERIVVCG